MEILSNYSLEQYNTFGIDVNAKYFVEVTSIEELKEVIVWQKKNGVEMLILGGGSNMLLLNDLNVLAVKLNIKGIEVVLEENEDAFVSAGAGENWHEFVLETLDKGLFGLENLSLIPGCVGASPMQNIGAYGVEIKDRFEYLEALNVDSLELERFDNDSCQFGYRESVFKRNLKGKYIITKVVFRLSKNPRLNTSYGAIEKQLQDDGILNPSPKDVSNAVIKIRSSKLPDPNKIGNSGSFFKNPVISSHLLENIKSKYPDVVHYDVGNGNYKLAAGWLIEHAGWKGKTFDNYGVHKNQALVLVNYGGAEGQSIYNLSQNIIESVQEKYGVILEREVNIIS